MFDKYLGDLAYLKTEKGVISKDYHGMAWPVYKLEISGVTVITCKLEKIKS